jgi:hypothetical protein
MNLSNQKTAKKLLYLAFIIEISVAALAVFLGYTITMSGFSGVGTDTIVIPEYLAAFSTFLLFSLIALVELTRVPLVLSIYRTNSIAWKIIGTLFLITIMGLAVETLFFAQLQNNNIRLLSITDVDRKIENSRNNIINIEEEIETFSLTSEQIDANYEKSIKNAENERDKQISPLKEKIENLESSKEATLLRKQLDELKKDKEIFLTENSQKSQSRINNDNRIISLENQKKAEVSDAKETSEGDKIELEKLFNKKMKNYTDDKNRADKIIKDTLIINNTTETKVFSSKGDRKGNNAIINEEKEKKVEITKKEREATDDYESQLKDIKFKLTEELAAINTNYSDQISSINNQNENVIIKSEEETSLRTLEIDTQIKNLKEEINNKESAKYTEIDLEIEKINSEITERNLKFEDRRNNMRLKLELEKAALDEQEEKIAELNIAITGVKEEKLKFEGVKGDLIKNNIVYTFATHLTFLKECKEAKTAVSVTEECRSKTQFIWFGLIALVVSIAGTSVAFASEFMRTTPPERTRQRKYPLRHFLIKIARYSIKPKIKKIEKIITKEVEKIKYVDVEKIVFKEVETIKEVIKKEIVHVPVPTVRHELIIAESKNNSEESKAPSNISKSKKPIKEKDISSSKKATPKNKK